MDEEAVAAEALAEAETETSALLDTFLAHSLAWVSMAAATAQLDVLAALVGLARVTTLLFCVKTHSIDDSQYGPRIVHVSNPCKQSSDTRERQPYALAAFAAAADGPVCRPQFVPSNHPSSSAAAAAGGGGGCGGGGTPVLELHDLWHPCAVTAAASASSSSGGSQIVPNDVILGAPASDAPPPPAAGEPAAPQRAAAAASEPAAMTPPAMLLTGPNMGGKSTLLRATCVAVVGALYKLNPGYTQLEGDL
jgi:hypothetical protein